MIEILLALHDDPGLRIESFAKIKIRGLSTKNILHFFAMGKRTKNLQLQCLFTRSKNKACADCSKRKTFKSGETKKENNKWLTF